MEDTHVTSDARHVRKREEVFEYKPAFKAENTSVTYYNEGGRGCTLGEVIAMSTKEKRERRERIMNINVVRFPEKLPSNHFTRHDTNTSVKISTMVPRSFKVNELGVTVGDMEYGIHETSLTRFFSIDYDINSVLRDEGVVAMVQEHITAIDNLDDDEHDPEVLKEATLNEFSKGRIKCFGEDERRNCDSYRPNYRIVNPWFLVFNAVMTIFDLSTPSHVKNQCLFAAAYFANNYSMTNGCYLGQIARLADTWRVCDEVNQRVPRASRYVTDYMETLKQEWGLVELPILDGEKLYQLLKTSSWKDTLMRVNVTADAGQGWSKGTKRKDVVLSDVCYANEMVDFLFKMQVGLQDKPIDERSKQIEAFNDTFLRMRYNLMKIKPKLFVYAKEKVLKKTRNICVYTSAFQLLLGKAMTYMMHQPSNHEPLRLLTSGKRSKSLMGFVPLHKNFDSLLKHLHEEAQSDENPYKPWSYCFYSDNIFVYNYKVETLYSLDVEKMESTSSYEEASMIMDYILNSIGISQSIENEVVSTHLKFLGSKFCHFAPGVLSDMIVGAPGIGSGSQVTFLINHGRMALNVNRIMSYLVEHPNELDSTKHGGVIEGLKNTQVSFNLEMTTNTNTTSCKGDAKYVDPSVKYITYKNRFENPGTVTTFGPIIDTDILGYSCTPVMDNEGMIYMVPCLDYERIMKSLMFRKEHGALKKAEDADLMINIVSLLTLQMLYGIGGFAYETVHYLITNSALSLKNQIDNAISVRVTPEGTLSMMEQVAEILTKEAAEYLSIDIDEGEINISDVSNAAAVNMARGVISMVESIINKNYEWSIFFSRKNVLQKYHGIV